MDTKVLIIGANGQIGSELTVALQKIHGKENVITSDIRENNTNVFFEKLDATDKEAIEKIVKKHAITDVYLMAAMLSAVAEKNPEKAWELNMRSLLYILDLAKDGLIKRIFWPSSIAVFGPTTPKIKTPQHTIAEPSTVYGISKLAGERWCEYYFKNYGVDVRSVRYPGLISWKTKPGGGTTDYAVDIYHHAVKGGSYECFLNEETILPMMYMDDAIAATINIMQAAPEKIKIRSSYNIAAISFNPAEIFDSIKKHIPEFEIHYNPDFRQKIADTWPQSIDDSEARADWGWKHSFDLDAMTEIMLLNLKKEYSNQN
ncbi:NAD-dependent epimerase/dehydratase family protein [Leptobacterium sp. I13]|uniref:NAD-dependent epimerase/dehydratase family protein n=1 Tax=Leptobacterium meishanense TaxID=3128904 RepID=UPI0030EF23F9